MNREFAGTEILTRYHGRVGTLRATSRNAAGQILKFVWALRNERSLTTDQEVPGSIPGSAVGFFSSGELFHGMHRLEVYVFFVHVQSCIVFWGGPCTLLSSVLLCQHGVLSYRKSLAAVKVNRRERRKGGNGIACNCCGLATPVTSPELSDLRADLGSRTAYLIPKSPDWEIRSVCCDHQWDLESIWLHQATLRGQGEKFSA